MFLVISFLITLSAHCLNFCLLLTKTLFQVLNLFACLLKNKALPALSVLKIQRVVKTM